MGILPHAIYHFSIGKQSVYFRSGKTDRRLHLAFYGWNKSYDQKRCKRNTYGHKVCAIGPTSSDSVNGIPGVDGDSYFDKVVVDGYKVTITINGVDYDRSSRPDFSHAYFSNDDVTIQGGTFNKTDDINMSEIGGGGICVIYGASLTIYDGNFAGDIIFCSRR